MPTKVKSLVLLFSLTILFIGCTKDNEALQAKEGQDVAELTAVPSGSTIIRVHVKNLRGSNMVPAIKTPTVGNIVGILKDNKTIQYRLELFKLRPGEYATSAILFVGEPGDPADTPVKVFPFGPSDNNKTLTMPLTDDEFDGVLYLLSPPVKPLLPSSFFVITTNMAPTGLVRAPVILP